MEYIILYFLIKNKVKKGVINMGFIINKKSKVIHKDTCRCVTEKYKKTKNNKKCIYDKFNTIKAAENYFIRLDKEYSYCGNCKPQK